jgi:hypothetical protein
MHHSPIMPQSNSPDVPRITAQRNAAFAAAVLLTGVLACAGWALEVFPGRTAKTLGAENISLRSDLRAAQVALGDTQRSLVGTQEALTNTQLALANTQAALARAQANPR